MKDVDGKLVVEEDSLMEVCRAHYEISNNECAWEHDINYFQSLSAAEEIPSEE